MNKINNHKQNEIGHWGDIIKVKLDVIKKFAGTKILDIGCSKGDYVIYLNNHGYDSYGCDITKDELWKRSPDKFKIGNIYKLPYRDKSFDTLVAFEIFEHLENPPSALKELSRVASKNIIISVPNCEIPPAFFYSGLSFYHNIDKTHINRFTEKDIKELLENNGYKVNFFRAISPIRPVVLFLYTWYLPLTIAFFIGKIVTRIYLGRRINSDLIIVASFK